jgi:hypothetical protein
VLVKKSNTHFLHRLTLGTRCTKRVLMGKDAGAGDTTIDATEITLVGVFEGVAPGGFVPANVLISA